MLAQQVDAGGHRASLRYASNRSGRVAGGSWYLRDRNGAGGKYFSFAFGEPGDLPVVGDWNGHGIETVGVYRAGARHPCSEIGRRQREPDARPRCQKKRGPADTPQSVAVARADAL